MNIIINGAGGRMGRALTRMAEEKGIAVTAKVDLFVEEPGFCKSLEEVTESADCIVDFSNHAGVGELLSYALQQKLPTVICTTGHTEAELEQIRQASGEIPVFHSGNMSLGIALLTQLARKTAAMFPDADVEIVESHHNQKLDVPSGTALMLAKAVQSARPDATLLVGRHENGKRPKGEIGVHSLRMGATVGIHEVIVNTGTQIITLKHEAQDRALFAEGALSAAAFLVTKPAGLYNMDSMVKE